MFQFHKGTIRTQDFNDDNDDPIGFNSIKVRLEPGKGGVAQAITKFQFHKGTIRTFSRNACRP